MKTIRIKQGRDIRLRGAPKREVRDLDLPGRVAVQPRDFRGVKPRPLVKPGATVKIGTPVLEDKNHEGVVLVSPVSGTVEAVNRGEKRALLSVVIAAEADGEAESFKTYPSAEVAGLSREVVVRQLLDGGVWPCLRQRPFSKIADPAITPKSIFVQAISTEPHGLDPDVVLRDRQEDFQYGLEVLRRLTDGAVHLCLWTHSSSPALLEAKNVRSTMFGGPHPAGNVGTHIHHLDPILKGETVWFIRAEDVLRVACLFKEGRFSPERVVAVGGEGVPEDRRFYARTVIGAPVAYLTGGVPPEGLRFISGSVLSGTEAGPDGFVGFYDTQVTVLPAGGERELLGWLMPGADKYTFSRTFLSAFRGGFAEEVSLDTDKNGGDRAIVLNHLYDDYVALDTCTYFLLKAVISGDIEEAEKLGILECDEEDFALATFACPSKTDVGHIIRQGLELIEEEG